MNVAAFFKNRVGYYYYSLLRRDNITLTKIVSRKDLLELGTEYGGWKIPANLLDSSSICYCVGCGEDISFDLALIQRFGCKVFAFDPTPRAIKYVMENTSEYPDYHFSEVGLWDKEERLKFYTPKDPTHVSHSIVNLQKTCEYIEIEVKRLKKLMQENCHVKIDLLKIDIEGAEYKVIDSILEDQLNVRIICVEYDECFNPLDQDYKQRIRSSVTSLISAGYVLVCSQGNGNYTFVKES